MLKLWSKILFLERIDMGIIKKIFTVNYKQMNRLITQMREQTGRSYLNLFFDMFDCYRKYGFTWQNYITYSFHKHKDPAHRESYLSDGRDVTAIIEKCNSKEHMVFFYDKGEFALKFKEFAGREVIDLRKVKKEDFLDFCKRHQRFYAKIPRSHGGEGVTFVDLEKYNSAEEAYSFLKDKGYLVVEEEIIESEELKGMSLNSLNNLRFGTIIDTKGEVHLVYSVARISQMDNKWVANGNGWSLLSEDGCIMFPLYLNEPNEHYVEKHKETGFVYPGFCFSKYKEAKEMVLKAAAMVPEVKYVGWDVAFSKDGPLLLEGNLNPAAELFQTYSQMPDGKGRLKDFEELLGIKLR